MIFFIIARCILFILKTYFYFVDIFMCILQRPILVCAIYGTKTVSYLKFIGNRFSADLKQP